jgi:ankyrin repeat protein
MEKNFTLSKQDGTKFCPKDFVDIIFMIIKDSFSKNQKDFVFKITEDIVDEEFEAQLDRTKIKIDSIVEMDCKVVRGDENFKNTCQNFNNMHVSEVRRYINKNLSFVNYIDDEGNTPLIWASTYGNYFVVKLLLELNKYVIHHFNNEGKTAIDYASANGHTNCVKLLLRYDSDELLISHGYLNGHYFEVFIMKYNNWEKYFENSKKCKVNKLINV